MLQLSSDESFHFELLRNISHARYYGADISEVLEAAEKIEAGNFESFAAVFEELANRVRKQADQINSTKHPVSARDAYFRASTYYRAADFFLHGNPDDARIEEFWQAQTECFDRANSFLDIPGRRIELQADGFKVQAIFYAAAKDDAPRPTMILGNGYDGAQEEMLHVFGFGALERGYNVVLYEGPGQPSVRRYQGAAFIPEWERVVTPLVNYLESLPQVDAKQIGLLGYSMGGFLALRAAAFEHRVAAVFAVDGIYDVFEAYLAMLPPPWKELFLSEKAGDHDKLDTAVREMLVTGKASSKVRWGIEQGLWSYKTASAVDWFTKVKDYTMEGIVDKIQCPVWIGDATDDQFFKAQPQKLKKALGDRGHLVELTATDGASNHCHVGSMAFINQIIFDWFSGIISQ